MTGGERRTKHVHKAPASAARPVRQGGAAGTGGGVQEPPLPLPPGGWDTLPHACLAKVFDSLELRDLAAASSVCTTWRYEAGLDSRWRAFWMQQVSDSELWTWAKAEGGYRQQLRARQLVRRGDCAATVFPFSRRDGPVTEVLFFNGGPEEHQKRILTVQSPKVPGECVRLHGATLKVWDVASLAAQRPLLVVHDVLKHLQLEDGRLFCWRVAQDAVVLTACSDPSDEAGALEAATWAEHPAIVSSVLQPGPGAPRLRDVPLEATFGRGVTPCEWLDMSGGMIAGSLMVPSRQRLVMRLFDLSSGRCVRASSCAVPAEDQEMFLGDHEVTMVVTRSSEGGSLVAATCALFDTRVFLWRLRYDAATAGQAAAAATGPRSPGSSPAAAGVAAGDAAEAAAHAAWLAVRGAAWDPAAAQQLEQGQLEQGQLEQGQQGGQERERGAGGAPQRGRELRHAFTAPDQEPIVDISISTAAARLFIVGMEHIFIADLHGTPLLQVSTLMWRGVMQPGQAVGPSDVGAFSWPLPNTGKCVFFLDTTNSLFIAEFKRPQMADFWYMQQCAENGLPARRPQFDHHIAQGFPEGAGNLPYYVQSHTDLRPPPLAAPHATQHGRAAGPRCAEPAIVEYSQDGGVLFTTADASCSAVAALLSAEKAAGSYLEGLGPAGVRPRGGARAAVVRGGRGPPRGRPLAPRALVLIDTATGCRFKAVPMDGQVEAVHSAGQFLLAAVAGPGGEGLAGSLVVLDFSGAGLGATPAPAAGKAAQRAGGSKRRGKAATAAAAAEEEEAAEGEAGSGKRKPRRQQQQQQKQQGKQKQQRSGSRGGGGSGGGGRRKAADEEASSPRGKRRR